METLMSKGPGRIERALAAIFDAERDNAFTLEDLAERVWPDLYPDLQGDPVAKKHRVSLARAARNLAKRRPEIQWLDGEGLGGALVFFRHDEVMSYAMARLKADRFEHYRSNDPRRRRRTIERESRLRRTLGDDRHSELMGPDGAWRRHVEIFLARRDGDVEKAAQLEAEQEAASARIWASLRGLL